MNVYDPNDPNRIRPTARLMARVESMRAQYDRDGRLVAHEATLSLQASDAADAGIRHGIGGGCGPTHLMLDVEQSAGVAPGTWLALDVRPATSDEAKRALETERARFEKARAEQERVFGPAIGRCVP